MGDGSFLRFIKRAELFFRHIFCGMIYYREIGKVK